MFRAPIKPIKPTPSSRGLIVIYLKTYRWQYVVKSESPVKIGKVSTNKKKEKKICGLGKHYRRQKNL